MSILGTPICACGGDLPTEHVPTVNDRGVPMCDECADMLVAMRESVCAVCGAAPGVWCPHLGEDQPPEGAVS